jgi:transposase
MDAKKKTVAARERNAVERYLFADVAATVPAERVIIIDETGTQRDMHPRYARAPKGQRAFASAARNYGRHVSVISSLSLAGMGPTLALEGAVDTAVFATFVRELLVPVLRPGDIVVLDNLSCHKADVIDHAVRAAGARLLFLPAYSPDFSPIEHAFSKLKAFLRRARPQSLHDLFEAIHAALDTISVTDALGFFCAAGFTNIR